MGTRVRVDGAGLHMVQETDVLEMMAEEVKACNEAKGWYDRDRTFGDDIALLHSEVSEMLEAFRDGGLADQTKTVLIKGCSDPQCGDSTWDHECDDKYGPGKPEGVGSEFADVLVRLLDTCSRYNIDLFAEWRRKVNYNWTRPVRHGGKAL